MGRCVQYDIMGYEIYIERRKGKHISLNEWEDFIKLDSSIEKSEEESKIYYWKLHPINIEEKDTPWLIYSEGRISTRKPDEFITLKMFQIANKLGADLLDDEGELGEEYREGIRKGYSTNTE